MLLFSPCWVNGWVIGVVEEVVDEVGLGDDVGTSIVIGAELALVDDISSFLHCYSLIYLSSVL